jgi:hypothetical protein
MNKLSGADVRRLLNLPFLKPDSRSACLPVLAITVHVFVFIIFASHDGGRVTSWHPHDIQVQLRIHFHPRWS